MTEICLRCGEHPVATEDPPRFPFCEACWPEVSARSNYFVDEDGHFDRFMTEAEEAESYRQSGEGALAMAEEEENRHG